MISLCGTCMVRARAAAIWTRQPAHMLTEREGLVCTSCGRACLSEQYRHTAFCASVADLKLAEYAAEACA